VRQRKASNAWLAFALLATYRPAPAFAPWHCDTISTGLHLQQYRAAQNLFLWLRSGAILDD